MSTASKDSRVNELFTEGSHHRNLSVIAINQNLYYNKDPTQRRNCHYLVLFNNPIDKQQVMILARQMYPENAQHLMRHFASATSKPYGYLLIDLKPTTPDHLRMRTNVLANQIQPERINGQTKETTDHLTSTVPNDLTYYCDQPEEDMPSCDDCGLMFDSLHDVQRHVKKWCPENESSKRKREDNEVPVEKSTDSINSKEDESHAFDIIARQAIKETKDEWNTKRRKYMDNGLEEKEAKLKANEKLRFKDIDTFVKKYLEIVGNIIILNNGPIHSRVMKRVRFYLDQNYGFEKAVKMAIMKYKNEFEQFIDDCEYDRTDTDDEEGTDNEEEEEEEEGEEEVEEEGGANSGNVSRSTL